MGDNQQPKPEGHVVKCGFCDGDGRTQIYPVTVKCDVCKGVGSVLLK